MTRHSLREELFKLLFRVEFNDLTEMDTQFDLFKEEEKLEPADAEEIKSRFDDIVAGIDIIDADLNDHVTGWDTSRIGKVELTILRLAIYEIKKDDKVPTAAAINEAVELAKKFGPDGAASFINGVLSKFA